MTDTPVSPGEAVQRVLAEPGLLAMAVQPIVNLDTGLTVGYEALTRVPASWRVRPDQLFEAARAAGQSGALTQRVLRATFALLDAVPVGSFMTVNVDPVDLVDPGVIDIFARRGNLTGLVVEVTEHQWPPEHDQVTATLSAVKAAGGMIAADDVGAAHAGVQQLLRVRPQMVKIDRELIHRLGIDPVAEALLRAFGILCDALDAWVIVEGVETQTQLSALYRLGVPLAQGFLLARPGPPWPTVDTTTVLLDRLPVDDDFETQIASTLAALVDPLQPGEYIRAQDGRYRLAGATIPCITAAPSTPLARAASHAMSRDAAQRFTPLLITSSSGEAIGTVSMENLLLALAATATPGTDQAAL
ncbi:EAL domain-containing protein [Solicola sp. PLA-1-18]|uniref:EAL domain-containing protein n=1 Tax=Solicola sp. PLA-1-18 TaxID=3380532 RepID=UPI003B7D780E